MASKPKGMIDLGKSYGDKTAEIDTPSKKVVFPKVHISDQPDLHDLPDGEFYFIAKGKVVAHSESSDDNGDHCSCEIEVRSIKPISKDEAGQTATTLEDALDEIEEGKDEPADEPTDEDDAEA